MCPPPTLQYLNLSIFTASYGVHFFFYPHMMLPDALFPSPPTPSSPPSELQGSSRDCFHPFMYFSGCLHHVPNKYIHALGFCTHYSKPPLVPRQCLSACCPHLWNSFLPVLQTMNSYSSCEAQFNIRPCGISLGHSAPSVLPK